MLIRDIISQGHKPRTILDTTNVKQVVKDMVDHHHNSFLVVDHHDNPLGYTSIQDIVKSIIPVEFVNNPAIAKAMYKEEFLQELCADMADVQIGSIMNKDLLVVTADENIMAVFALFLKHDVYFLCVKEENKVVAVLTRRDMRRILADAMDIRRER